MRPPALARRQAGQAAVVALFLALCLAAQRSQAQSQELTNTLMPTNNPCTSCERAAALPNGANSTVPIAPAEPQTLPIAPLPQQPAFRLNEVRIVGAQAISADELASLKQPYIGRDVTLADLEKLAQQITALYRQRGYFLAQALVPVQTVQNGVVEISVVEGKLGVVLVTVAPDAPITEARVRAFLAPLQPGMAVETSRYERAMLLLSDQPGIRVTSSLQEGAQAGTTDLSIDVVAATRWQFTIDGDNWGTKETGEYRLGGTARWTSPFGIGDNMDLRLMDTDSNGTLFGRVSYEAPIGSSGLRAGIGLARVDYSLGGAFIDLRARGTADVLDISLDYPLIRSREQNLFVRLSANDQDLTDKYEAIGFSTEKHIKGVGFGWTWERRDSLWGGGYSASAGSFYHGDLDILDPLSAALDQSDVGTHTAGSFNKLTVQLSRLQSIVDRNSLYLAVGGQWSSKNLDSSQKLSLGGPQAVRAYQSGTLLVDEGVIGTAEWRFSYNAEFTPFLFYDAARGRLLRDPIFGGIVNSQSVRGGGIGVSWTRTRNFSINATLAWRDGEPPTVATNGGGHNPQLFVQLQKAF